MSKRTPLPKFNTPLGIARYPHLNKPDTRFVDEGVYKCDLRVPVEESLELVAYLQEIRDAKFDELDAKKKKTYTLADVCEVELDDSGDETGYVIFKTKLNAIGKNKEGEVWNNQPKLFDAFGNPVDSDEVQVWSGSKLIVAGRVMPYVMASNKTVGVSLKCEGVQIVELVSGGGATADSFGFGKVSGGFETGDAKEMKAPSKSSAPAEDEEDDEEDEDF